MEEDEVEEPDVIEEVIEPSIVDAEDDDPLKRRFEEYKKYQETI